MCVRERDAHWPIDLRDVPELLMLLEDHAMSVEIQLASVSGSIAIRAAGIRCSRMGDCLCLDAPQSSVSIPLHRLSSARAVCRMTGLARRISLELMCADASHRLTVTDPGRGAAVWCRVMEALAPGRRAPPVVAEGGIRTDVRR